MRNYRILFSATNLESRYLATLLATKLEALDKNNQALPEGEQKPIVHLVEYRREVEYQPSYKVDDTFAVGVEVHPSHLAKELTMTAGNIIIYAYDHQYEPTSVMRQGVLAALQSQYKLSDENVDRIVLNKNMVNTMHRRQLLPGDSVDMYSPLHFLVLGDWISGGAKEETSGRPGAEKPTVELEVARIVADYQNLDMLDHGQLVTAHETAHALDLCSLQGMLKFTPRVSGSVSKDSAKFQELLIKRAVTASYIQRTLRYQWIGTQSKGRQFLNMMMPREHVVYAARLLSYAHDRFIMYEDGSNCRVWTILAPDVYEGQGIADLLKPHDVWSEKRFVYAITDLPKLN